MSGDLPDDHRGSAGGPGGALHRPGGGSGWSGGAVGEPGRPEVSDWLPLLIPLPRRAPDELS
ncbi:hypothetical protein [Saccharothrix algeriensis]|uniref:Uncharacterized protein n=1 Tax=Saccharothrix algeriensis TaxID=173560 RepID=A0ABS2S974_9PSEU|nr:hypothetical protein [Saccharothrix algeriensis]MBM7812797.1 hypothetical protein [Saccharothrix algeriensis]